MKVGEGLHKPGKPYIVMVHALGYTKSKFCFLPLKQNVKMTLGDARLPSGLWKSIQHMRKGEIAKIWIKPGEFGFGRENNPEALQWPELVKDNEELKQKLRDEEIYYEIELIDWIVRSDLIGDGQLMKTFEIVATGYDRCGDDDEVIFDYKISKLNEKSEDEELEKGENEVYSMISKETHGSNINSAHSEALDKKLGISTASPKVLNPSLDLQNDGKFTPVMRKILKSMKLGEKSFTVVQYSWMQKHDPEGIEKYKMKETERLKIDITFKKLVHIEDFYKDGTVYIKTLEKGTGTESPLSDSFVALKIKTSYNKFSEEEKEEVLCDTEKPVEYELDGYMLPPLLRNIMKTFKLNEKVEVHTILKDEIIPEFEDEKNNLFKTEWFDKVGEIDEATGNQRWIIFTIELIAFETPEAMHGLFMKDKIPRLMRLKEIGGRFFKMQNWPKALKTYQRLYSHFNLKDIYNNLQKEDANSEKYKILIKEFKKIELQSLTNILVVMNKLKYWKEMVEITPKALELDPKNIKALFLDGKAQLNLAEYDQAIGNFKEILKIDPENKEAAKELLKCKKEKKKYQDKSRAMYKFE